MFYHLLYLYELNRRAIVFMKMVKDRQMLMAADFAGYPLKEAIKEYLEKKGWTVTDIGNCHCELYDRSEGLSSVPLACKC